MEWIWWMKVERGQDDEGQGGGREGDNGGEEKDVGIEGLRR